MSQKSRAKRLAKQRAGRDKFLNPLDYQARQEGTAISNAFSSHTIDFGKRMNKYYWCDGQKFLTGKKHRRVCVGMTACEPAQHVRRKQASEQTNLQSPVVHKRVENPQLYKTLSIRRVLHLIEYKTNRIQCIHN